MNTLSTHKSAASASHLETPREYLGKVFRSLACFGVLAASVWGLLIVASLPSCKSVAPTYDAQVISATRRLAADADTVLAQAREPFDRHALEVAGLRQRLKQMSDAARARGRGNASVVAQWDLMALPRAKGGELLGAMLDEWETNAVLEDPLLKHRRRIVQEAFRAIVAAEEDRPPGLQERLIMETVLGSDAYAEPDASLFPAEGGAR